MQNEVTQAFSSMLEEDQISKKLEDKFLKFMHKYKDKISELPKNGKALNKLRDATQDLKV